MSRWLYCACALVTAIASHALAQQPYPNKPIRMIVPSSAGGTQDTLARLFAPKLGDRLGQPVVVENRPGAGGMIGASIVAKAAADGYTLLLGGPGFAVGAAVHANLPYDPVKDFSGVAQIGYSTTVLVVGPSLGVKSVKELIALAHAQPGKILFGSSGGGSATFMNAERFRMAAGIKAAHVGFKGQPEFLLEIMAGRVHYGVAGLGPSLPFIKDGRLLPLAVTTLRRAPLLPDVPTSAEVVPGWGRDGSQGILAPARTPRAIVHQLNKEAARILDMPEVRDRLLGVDFNILTSTPEEYDKMLRADIATFTRVAKEAGLRAK
ncbi:MAG: tripartite tricarboxylate transporter substrate binding protein [Burkholderiales bacterium]